MKNFEIVNDDRTESVNKTTIRVPEGCDGTDAEIFFAEYLAETENGRQFESSDGHVEAGKNLYVVRWS